VVRYLVFVGRLASGAVLWPLLVALVAAPAATAVAGDEVLAGPPSGIRIVDAVPRGPSVRERLTDIRRRIQAAVVYPPMARLQRVEGKTLVRFDIDPDGAAQDVEVFRTSGKPSLDRAAVRAVAAAAPLPWVYGRLEVPVRFELERRR
jgi:TonB family protein